eukprot:883658-Pyramimonas_sp.AAC.1
MRCNPAPHEPHTPPDQPERAHPTTHRPTTLTPSQAAVGWYQAAHPPQRQPIGPSASPAPPPTWAREYLAETSELNHRGWPIR